MGSAPRKRIVIASEHEGFELAQQLRDDLRQDFDVFEAGALSCEAVDYPSIAMDVTERVMGGEFDLGILICGTGIGMSIAAGKVRGSRVALCTNEFMAQMARRHNDANILCLGAWVTGTRLSLAIVRGFLQSEFEAGRHARRVEQIDTLAREQL